jgi:hypothetical protein
MMQLAHTKTSLSNPSRTTRTRNSMCQASKEVVAGGAGGAGGRGAGGMGQGGDRCKGRGGGRFDGRGRGRGGDCKQKDGGNGDVEDGHYSLQEHAELNSDQKSMLKTLRLARKDKQDTRSTAQLLTQIGSLDSKHLKQKKAETRMTKMLVTPTATTTPSRSPSHHVMVHSDSRHQRLPLNE